MLDGVRSGKAAYLLANDNFKYWSCKILCTEIVEKEAVRTDRGHDGATRAKLVERLPKTLGKMNLFASKKV
jgi:hypothetical protein